MTTLFRAYDVNNWDSVILEVNASSGTRATLGANVGTWIPTAANSVGSAMNSTGTGRQYANTSTGDTAKPRLAEFAGRRALQFGHTPGANTGLYSVTSPMDLRVYNAFTMGAMIWTGPNSNGVVFSTGRGELSAGRVGIRFDLEPRGDPDVVYEAMYRARWDGTTHAYLDPSYGNPGIGGWKVVWIEWNFGNGDGTEGALRGIFNNTEITEIFTVDYGADAGDTQHNRVVIGGLSSGSSLSEQFLNGYMSRFFYAAKTFTQAERDEIIQWLKGTKYVAYVAPTANNIAFPIEIAANTECWAMDVFNPGMTANSSISGTAATSNTSSVGHIPFTGSGGGNHRDGGPFMYTPGGTAERPVLHTNGPTVPRNALIFDGSGDRLVSSNVSYSSLTDSYPQHIYSWAEMYLQNGWSATTPNAAPILGTRNSAGAANNYASMLELSHDQMSCNLTLDTTTVSSPYWRDVTERHSQGWHFFETLTTISSNGADGIQTSFYRDGELLGSANSTVDANTSAGAIHNEVLVGHMNTSGTPTKIFGGTTATTTSRIGRSGFMRRIPSDPERALIRQWSEGFTYVGPAFPDELMSSMGAAYDPYDTVSMNTTTNGANVTSWAPTWANTSRTDGGGTANLTLISGRSSNTPLLTTDYKGYRCLNHSGIRYLEANTTGIALGTSLALTMGALVYIDSVSETATRGVPMHLHLPGTAANYQSYAGLIEIFTGGDANSYPYLRTRTGTTGDANNWVVTNDPIRSTVEGKWASIITTAQISTFSTGAVTVNHKTWVNGQLVDDATKSATVFQTNDALGKFTKYVLGGQVDRLEALVTNKDWNSYIGRHFWCEQYLSDNSDAVILDNWLRGRAYTAH